MRLQSASESLELSVMESLETPVRALPGVGPVREAALLQLGIRTLGDLVLHLPRTYLDRSCVSPLSAARPGEELVALVEVAKIGFTGNRGRNVSAVLRDATGCVKAVWFGQRYLQRSLRPGDRVLVMGRYRDDPRASLINPEIVTGERGSAGIPPGLVPVYPAAAGLAQSFLRKTVGVAIGCPAAAREVLPAELRGRVKLPDRRTVLESVHHPGSMDEAEASRRLLAYEELLVHHLRLLHSRESLRVLTARTLSDPREGTEGDLVADVLRRLPYSLTEDQARAFEEIRLDLRETRPMLRLLQGDVGSGKTVVALLACVLAAAARAQSCIVVPTEILARQHADSLARMLGETGVRCEILLGGMPAGVRRGILAELRRGGVQILIATHAVLGQGVVFHGLGLIIVDEQHRFGVSHRLRAWSKAEAPHVLLMSATPIPRSLHAVLHGDLDTTTLRVRPPGRPVVRTHVVPRRRWDAMMQFIASRLELGEQAYFIYPKISESERGDDTTRDAVRMHRQIRDHPAMRKFSIELLHGRSGHETRSSVLGRLRAGASHGLVATSIVEVGIDLPRATVMVIEHPDRYGMAQIHQLRGRVGRGAGMVAHCFLVVSEMPRGVARERLRILCRESDGFRIAEEDLRMRGPGDALGTAQSGFHLFRAADVLRDRDLLDRARADARMLLTVEGMESTAILSVVSGKDAAGSPNSIAGL